VEVEDVGNESTRSMPMLAPRRVPPCLIASVANVEHLHDDTGPLAVPPVLQPSAASWAQLREEKPVPPPFLDDGGVAHPR